MGPRRVKVRCNTRPSSDLPRAWYLASSWLCSARSRSAAGEGVTLRATEDLVSERASLPYLWKGSVFIAVEAVKPCFDVGFIHGEAVTKFGPRFLKTRAFAGKAVFQRLLLRFPRRKFSHRSHAPHHSNRWGALRDFPAMGGGRPGSFTLARGCRRYAGQGSRPASDSRRLPLRSADGFQTGKGRRHVPPPRPTPGTSSHRPAPSHRGSTFFNTKITKGRLWRPTPRRKEDWDAVSDNPEWTEEDIRQAKAFAEVFPELVESVRRSRGRPPAENPKRQVTLRIDSDVIERFRAGGPGWQSRINEALRKAAGVK